MILNKDKKVQVVYHLADIHIRNDIGRHDEYRSVFDRLFKKIGKEEKEFVIVVCGDIVHNKTMLRPECIDLVKYFFFGLCELSDVIVISGNHDCNINNQDSMNSLEPIIGTHFDTTNNIYLLDNDKNYRYGNINFGVTTIYADNVTKAVNKKNMVSIALYHGTIHGSRVDNDYKITNNDLFRKKDFKSYDYAFLGDIHKMQYLDETMAYSSSLIQQNFGESMTDHGYIRWNIKTGRSKFHRIPNDYGYVVGELNNDGTYDIPEHNFRYPRIKLLYSGATKQLIRNAMERIRSDYDRCELISQYRMKNNDGGTNVVVDEIKSMDDVRSMINKYMKDNDINDDDIIDTIDDIIESLDYDYNKTTRSIKLNRMTFSDLFVYGSDNVIDFSNMNKINGIIAKNGYGKSSIIDSILFGIYGKYSRGERYQAVNINENRGSIMIDLMINTDRYIIERKLHTTHKKNDRKNTYTLSVKKNGKLITDDDKKATLSLINDSICSYDDLINTSMILQNSTTFIDLEPLKRKDYICRMLNMEILDMIMKKARFNVNSMRQMEQQYERDITIDVMEHKKRINDLTNDINDHMVAIDELNIATDDLKIKLEGCEINIDQIDDIEISKMEEELEELEKSIDDINIIPGSSIVNLSTAEDELYDMREERDAIFRELGTNEVVRGNHVNIMKTNRKKRNMLMRSIKNIDKEALEKDIECYEELNNVISALDTKLNDKKEYLADVKQRAKKLKNHRINKDCDACMTNQVSKDKMHYDDEIDKTSGDIKTIATDIKDKRSKCAKLKESHNKYEKYTKMKEEHDALLEKSYIIDKSRELEELDKRIKDINDRIMLDIYKERYDKLKKKYNAGKELIKYRNDNTDINSIKDIIARNTRKITSLTNDMTAMTKRKDRLLYDIENYEKIRARITDISTKKVINDKISKLMSKEFIDYVLNDRTLPVIQQCVNNILDSIADFRISMEYSTQGIRVYKIEGDKLIDASCLCGFERFATNIAFRLALNKINTNIKTEFLIIDEGFGCCDDDNMYKLRSLFEYIRDRYKWCLIITHIDDIKNNIDRCIDIEIINNKSKIVC